MITAISKFKNPIFWQLVVVGTLFLGSIATLFINSLTAYLQPGQEAKIRLIMEEASHRLANAVSPEFEASIPDTGPVSAATNQRLEDLTQIVLGPYPGIEGGFFINHDLNEFAGYAFPTGPAHGPRHEKRRDPPPREEPYIRVQAEQSSNQEGTVPLVQIRDVGPSRVAVATMPVGIRRPARLVTWLMYRLTGPDQYHTLARRYLVSTILAIAGIVASLLIMLNLQRTLARERQSQDRLRDELKRTEHLASLGLLVAQVAHEIRNPLAGIRSTVQLWQRLPRESQTTESLQAVVTAVDRLDELLTGLLTFSRRDSLDRQSIDLNTVVRDVAELLRAQAVRQGVHLDATLDSRPAMIFGSAKQLRQVVLNLATNALQAMPHSGRLTCRTRVSAKVVELEIEDTGEGIDPGIRSRLFEPFFTTRSHGTGLGLALCREIIIQHDGQIELESAEPHGTLCRVTLPSTS